MSSKLGSILVIDDEKAMRLSLREVLERAGYEVFESATGQEGLNRASQLKPSAVLLDMGLPDLDGLTVLRKLREWAKFPILIVSVQDSESTIVRALDLGADDYVTKPFSAPQLLARVRTGLRRAQQDPGHPVVAFEDIVVDIPATEAKVAGKLVKLSSTEWELLRCLAQAAGKIITVEKIQREIWGQADESNLASLRVYVGHLRTKLGKNGAQFIMNEPGIGYRLQTS